MARPRRTGWRRSRRLGVLGAALIALVLVALPPMTVGSAAIRPLSGTPGPTGAPNFAVAASWYGKNPLPATTVASAFSISLVDPSTITLDWFQRVGPPPLFPVPVTAVAVHLYYFGFLLYGARTNLNPGAISGEANITLTPAPLGYLTAGVYSAKLELDGSNSSVLWSASFFVRATPVFVIGAVIPILLLIIAVLEMYGVASAARRGRRRRALKPEKAAPPDSKETSPEET